MAVPAALVIAVLAFRAAIFAAPADHPLHALQAKFPSHPAALTEQAMRDIGSAAARGQGMPDSARRAMAAATVADPLAATPFLVSGTMAQMAGDPTRAEEAFVAARHRDPRNAAARYFLADRFIRTNRVGEGLVEMAALARISEAASQPLAPALAAYARTPGAVPKLRQLFATTPALRDTTLEILASDPLNAGLILSLAPPLPVHQVPPPQWQASLVRSLVSSGDFAAADGMWRRLGGISNRGLLYDPQFRDRSASPPFNWQLTSGSAGIAEASGSGGLDVIYYGREETTLATQLVRLPAGIYRLAMRIQPPASAAWLSWTIACAAGESKPFFRLPVDAARQEILAGVFSVPAADCPAQWLLLRGQPGETSDTAQVTISGLRLEPIGVGP